ncbi:RluA family pseudouridine synthase [Amphibacillus sediminis]|uniref:RluA family pseudouridine synthase n=1 Tax=Amphibacillus sediminis TaxID=360185 RepID=UPI00082A9F78|nr:RluA family pseudouridine synthase [Amphibacillus sediminis]
MKWQITENEAGLLLRDYLKQNIGFSRNMIKVLKFDGGKLLVNGENVNVRTKLKKGDTVEVLFPKEVRAPRLKPVLIPLDIVYEDDFLLVINKTAGMTTVPSARHEDKTVANALIAYYDQKGLDYTVHIVTRLDRDTSGLMLVAKQRFCHSLLQNNKIDRRYQAVVEGILTSESGTISEPIARKQGSIIERTVARDGKPAITHYRTLKQVNGHTWLAIRLETGRTHQIRVHFAHIGHPLAGDDLYGGQTDKVKRQALHCVSLAFQHPITKQYLSFHSSWPDDLAPLVYTH